MGTPHKEAVPYLLFTLYTFSGRFQECVPDDCTVYMTLGSINSMLAKLIQMLSP